MKNQKAHYSLRQEAGSNVHKLYIYDDVTKYGDFDWWTWNYSESETSAQHFRKVLEEIPETDVIEAVSYTHLDVYKRQELQPGSRQQKRCRPETRGAR